MSNPKLAPILHLGIAVIVDRPIELRHGDARLLSLRLTSEEFARIDNALSTEGREPPTCIERVFLPSDCVRFRDSAGKLAYGKVKGIGIDGRAFTASGVRVRKVYSANINHLVPLNEPPATIFHTNEEISGRRSYPLSSSTLPELVLFESRDIATCTDVMLQEWVYFTNYKSSDDLSPRLLPHHARFCIRRSIT